MNTGKFNGQRLREALQFRAKKITELAEETGISKQSLSLYANDGNIPSFENIKKIADALQFPTDYFFSESNCQVDLGDTFFRSQALATKKTRNAQKVKLKYVAMLYDVIENYINFPTLNLPLVYDYTIPQEGIEVDSDETFAKIENLANEVRKYWKIGSGPVENLQYLLESNGIIVTGFNDVASEIDAFSQQIVVNGKRIIIIALAIGSKPIERLRFDMAHELGHILLHMNDDDNDEITKDEFAAREKQANFFASAFLLPKDTFLKSVTVYPNNVDYYEVLKKKWKVSMQAMMYRARQLNIISSNQFQYMMRIISKKGWRVKEPGDVPGQIKETIFQGAIDLLFDGGYLSADELLKQFNNYGIILLQSDLENLMYLKAGTLDHKAEIISFLSLKGKNNS